MLSAAVVACLFVATSAHNMGGQQQMGQQQMMGQQQNTLAGLLGRMGMSNQGMSNSGMNNGMNMMGNQNQGMNMMGQQNQGMNNMMGNQNQGMNMMGNQNQGMNNMMGNQGNQGNVGMMGGVMLTLLQSMLNNNNRNNMEMPKQEDTNEMKQIEEMMKMKMMAEMAEMMMANMEYKEKEKEFSGSMEAMCWLMTATYENYKRQSVPAFTRTTDSTLEEIDTMSKDWTEEQKQQYAIDMMNNEPDKYAEVFLRLITWACHSGEEYAKAVEMMDSINKGENESCRR